MAVSSTDWMILLSNTNQCIQHHCKNLQTLPKNLKKVCQYFINMLTDCKIEGLHKIPVDSKYYK